jgi:hypothetical protein
MASHLRLFVSHSGKDAVIAERLIELIQNALNLPASAIRCTSVDGYRLPGGAHTDEQLRAETLGADAFIGLVSPHSVCSMYVAFELGARWGANNHLLPILAPGVDDSVLEGPLTGLNTLRSDSRPQLHQMIQELAQHLGITPASPAAYERYIDRILELPPCNLPSNESVDSATANSVSSFLTRLKTFASETDKFHHISHNLDILPDRISFEQFASLLSQFTSESNKLQAIEKLRSRLARRSEEELTDLLSLFTSASNKHRAFELLRGSHANA